MTIKIESDIFSAEIDEIGAELHSFKRKSDDTEYIWQGDEKYWTSRSPILFPICGRLFGGKYYCDGKEYVMERHGIVRRAKFEGVKIGAARAEFVYKSSDESKKVYPFDFELKAAYEICGAALSVTYTVKNLGGGEMPFSIGSHPAFNVPFGKSGKFEEHYVEFERNCLQKTVYSPDCFCTGEFENYPLEDKKLFLKHELFDNDAIFFKADSGAVRLRSIKTDEYIEITYKDMTCLGLWQKCNSGAPFLCIEPWHGSPSFEGKIDDIFSKRDVITLKPNEKYENTYKIAIV